MESKTSYRTIERFGGVFRAFRAFRFFLRCAFGEFINNQCFQRAAALTFTTLLTLIPILVLFFVIFRAFGGLDMIESRLETFMFSHLLPESVASIKNYIQSLVSGFNSKTVSAVSIGFLLVAAYSLFSSIDASLNFIWKVRESRRFFSRLVNLWFILTISPLLLGYSLYLSAHLLDYNDVKAKTLVLLMKIILWITPAVLSWVTLALIYRFVPRVDVNWSSALLGSFFGAVCWEFSKYGFNVYVRHFANIKIVYGPYMLIPLFLLWVDLTWIIILAGAVITYTHQNIGYFKRALQAESHPLDGFSHGLAILATVTRAFLEGGKPPALLDISGEIGLTTEQTRRIIDRLESAGFLVKNVKTGGYIPARAPETISVEDVLELFQPLPEDEIHVPGVSRFLRAWDAQRKRSLRSVSMKDIVSGTFPDTFETGEKR